jgi:hypothetical protein
VRRRDGRDWRASLEVELLRLKKLSPQPRDELIRMQPRCMGLKDGANGAGNLERGQFGSVLDDFDLAEKFWERGLQFADDDFGAFKGVKRIICVTAAGREAEEIAANVLGRDEVGEEAEIPDLEGGGGRRAEVEEGLAVAAVLRGKES